MQAFNSKLLQDFISQKVIAPFYNIRLKKLESLQLNDILKRKNPYLFKAKNIQTAEELVRYILDAFLPSQEETIFGNLMEDLAIYVCSIVYKGYKAEQGKYKSVDLIFEKNDILYIVGIKSGPFWGNKDQIDKMKGNFNKAKKELSKTYNSRIVAVNGCIYGKDNKHLKGASGSTYYKYCGQEFWNFITGDSDFYKKIIIPIDKEAKERDIKCQEIYSSKINELTKDFSNNFLSKEGHISWEKIIDFVSKKNN